MSNTPNQFTLNHWKVFYFLGAILFFIFTLFLIFFQNQNIRYSYLIQHADNLEYQKDYSHAYRIWKKIYEKNPSESYYLIKIIQNLLLQEDYSSVIKNVEMYQLNVNNQDTFLLLLKHGLFSARKLNQDSLTHKFIFQINNILKVSVLWDNKTNKWIYTDENFTINKLKKWVDAMYSLLDEELSIYTIIKDTETPFFYYYGTISFNKKQFLENDQYEYLAFTYSSRVNPNDFSEHLSLGFLFFTLKKSNFLNSTWLNQLKNLIEKTNEGDLLTFLKDARLVIPISYQNQNYVFNMEYDNLPKELLILIEKKLKNLKNLQELEKLKSVFVYLRTKITLK